MTLNVSHSHVWRSIFIYFLYRLGRSAGDRISIYSTRDLKLDQHAREEYRVCLVKLSGTFVLRLVHTKLKLLLGPSSLDTGRRGPAARLRTLH